MALIDDKIDMEMLKYILKTDVQSGLPCNLPNKLLYSLIADMDKYDQLNDDEADILYLVGPMLVIEYIVAHKNGRLYKEGSKADNMDFDDLVDLLHMLRMEFALEDMRRKGELNYTPANLKNIFERRNLNFTRG